MKFKNLTSTESISECGEYERKSTYYASLKKSFMNCWHIPTGAHVAAGFSAKEVSDRCDEHKARISQQQPSAAGV